MKKVKYVKDGFETVMTDKVAKIYEKKGKVKVLGDAKEEAAPEKKPGKGEKESKE